MNGLPINKLTALTKHFGNDLLNDYARCDELLSDFCGECRLEVNLLISALREGCAKVLLESAGDGVVADDLYVRLVRQLQKNAGIMEEYAEWGVKGVATALELKVGIPLKTEPLVTASSASYVPPYPPILVPEVTKPPTSIPSVHYAAVCNILLKSGSDWKDPEVWAQIDGDVKRLCANTKLAEHEIRNMMRLAWPSVEKDYEAQEIKKQQEKIAAERKLHEEKTLKELEAKRYQQHANLLSVWLENLPEDKWDYDQWDSFVSSLEPPVNIAGLEKRRDSAIITHDEYSVKYLKTGLILTRNGNIAGKSMKYDEAIEWVKMLDYGGYNDWHLPTKEEIEIFVKVGGAQLSEWLNTNGFNNVQTGWYWTSSSSACSTLGAWGVSMHDGTLNRHGKTSDYFVWPVRSCR